MQCVRCLVQVARCSRCRVSNIVYCTYTATYHPRLVAEIVHRVQRVDALNPRVLQPDDDAAVVPVPVHAERVLSHQDKVWLQRPETAQAQEDINQTL